jgi:hypothetical protein
MLERSEGLADWTKHHLQEIQESTHMSMVVHPISEPSLDISHPNSHYHSRSQKTTAPSSVDYTWKLCSYFGTIQIICLLSDGFNSDSTLIWTTAMKQCMDIGPRPRVWNFLIILIFALTLADGLCCAWFIYLLLVLVSGDRD